MIDQPFLINLVLGFVQNFLPDFTAGEIIWVRSLKSSRYAVLNVQCRSVVAATRVKSTFAGIVKTTPHPPYLGKVINLIS